MSWKGSGNAEHGESVKINSKLINPFRGLGHETMEKRLKDFMQSTGFSSEPENVFKEELFRKGIYLAQDPNAFDPDRSRPDGLTLSTAEKSALHQEIKHHWKQPLILYALVACCSLGAAVQGWDEAAMNQAQLAFWREFPPYKDFKLHDNFNILGTSTCQSNEAYGDQNQGDDLQGQKRNFILLFGLVNSAPYLCCALLGCWLSAPMNRYFGRRGTIFISCLISCAACIWQAFTYSNTLIASASDWKQMLIARFALGLGIGPKSSTVPVYAAECSPHQIRGALVMMWQMWTAFGIMLGNLAGLAFIHSGVPQHLRWRLVIGSPMLFPIIVCLFIFMLPESPRWLVQKAQRSAKPEYFQKAFNSFSRLKQNDIQAARDMIRIYYVLLEEDRLTKDYTLFFELWTRPRNRRALVASLLCMFLQQFGGINNFAYYSTFILIKACFQRRLALKLSQVFGVLNFVFALPAFFLIDRFGRRRLLLVTFPLMAGFEFIAAFAFNAEDTARRVLFLLGMYGFTIAYSLGEGPIPFVYASESMPLYVRDIGMAHATAVNWFFNFLLALTFPLLFKYFKHTGAFAFYAAWCVVGWFLVLLFVYETKGQSLEELDWHFSIPSKEYAREALSRFGYRFQKYCLRRKGIQMQDSRVTVEEYALDYGLRPTLLVPSPMRAAKSRRRQDAPH